MRKDIHPEDYRMVVFKDMTNDYTFLGRSSAALLKQLNGKTETNIL
jgi:ribosomal protein L31